MEKCRLSPQQESEQHSTSEQHLTFDRATVRPHNTLLKLLAFLEQFYREFQLKSFQLKFDPVKDRIEIIDIFLCTNIYAIRLFQSRL